ncbi:hypothetical protein ACJX0J_040440, partial [Zea mays]
ELFCPSHVRREGEASTGYSFHPGVLYKKHCCIEYVTGPIVTESNNMDLHIDKLALFVLPNINTFCLSKIAFIVELKIEYSFIINLFENANINIIAFYTYN